MLTTCCANSARFEAAQADLGRHAQHSQLYEQNKVREVMGHPVVVPSKQHASAVIAVQMRRQMKCGYTVSEHCNTKSTCHKHFLQG